MLQNVRNFWVKGVLEQSLYAVARLELGLTTQPDAVEDVWNVLVQRPEQTPQPLPPGTRISTAFDDVGNVLLILGAPGTGKTTLLLELTKDLLARAEQDPNHPLPVVFNLSSWAVRQSPLAAWLVDELCERYQVPRKHAQIWIDKDLILPLLDGLDEVASAHRSACVEAINAFRAQHGLVPLAVCSRVADYAALTTKLNLAGALVVQPLTRQQVDHYLAQAGKPLAGVRAALQDDKTLWELLDTPLMLSVAALAFQGRSAAEVQITGTLEERKTQLFAAYTDAVFKRRGKAARYSRQQTVQWLVWLAGAMAQHNQSVLYLEWLQPDWLSQKQQRLVNSGAGILAGLIFWLCFELSTYGLPNHPAISLGRALFFTISGLAIGSFIIPNKTIQPAEMLAYQWFGLLASSVGGLISGLIFSLLIGLGSMLLGLIDLLDKRFGFNLIHILPPGTRLIDIFLSTGMLGMLFGLLFGLHEALKKGAIMTRVTPNEGIWRSLQNALLIWLVVGLVGGLLFGLLYWQAGRRFWLIEGLLEFGPPVGLLFGLGKGGFACLQHLVLRFLLWRNNYAPWRYVRFLDYAAERVFLRKVGGGYIFVHRMLLEYFAALYSSPPTSSSKAPVNE